MTEECRACRFWQKWRDHIGCCRRYPPTPLSRGGNPNTYANPETRPDFWCGEFRPKDTPT